SADQAIRKAAPEEPYEACGRRALCRDGVAGLSQPRRGHDFPIILGEITGWEGLANMNTPNAYAPPKANVADVSPGDAHTLASRLSRLGAAIIDGLIVGALVYTPIIVGGGMGSALGEMTRTNSSAAFWALFVSGAGLVSLLLFIGWAVITFRLVAANGQTIAKKLVGIK